MPETTTQLPDHMTLADYDLTGFVPGFPPWGAAVAECIDRQVTASADCARCGHPGLRYLPYHHATARRYRAFGQCPRCRHAEEI
jgi:hypothetical protein